LGHLEKEASWRRFFYFFNAGRRSVRVLPIGLFEGTGENQNMPDKEETFLSYTEVG